MNTVDIEIEMNGKKVYTCQLPTGSVYEIEFPGEGFANVKAMRILCQPTDPALAEILSLVKKYAESPNAELRHPPGECVICDADRDHLIEAWKRYADVPDA